MTFKFLALALVALTSVLALLLLLVPASVMTLFAIDSGDAAAFLGRRAGVLFASQGVMWFLARNAPPSAARQALLIGVTIMMGGLACLGIGEFLRGFAGPGILLAAATEAFYAGCALWLWRRND